MSRVKLLIHSTWSAASANGSGRSRSFSRHVAVRHSQRMLLAAFAQQTSN